MSTRVIIIQAGPTPWDEESRISGSHSFPLTDEGKQQIAAVVDSLPAEIAAVYRPDESEACDEVAQLVAKAFKLKPKLEEDLRAVHLGLWEGLRHEELRRRFETSFPQWEKDPPTIMPPDGESSEQAMTRIAAALKKILRRNRGKTIVLAMRPMAMQIAAGILRGESLESMSGHVHKEEPMTTIEVDEQVLK